MAWAVKFEGVSKRYRGGGPRYGSLRHDLAQGFKRLGGLFTRDGRAPQGTLALDDVSFEVEQGESFAIIGPNGAGKTTALKLISRISYPTAGRVRVRGRVGALIEVGSGVHPELTARENIWLYGQILGMSKADVRRRFDEIVEFAELAHALDTPVKMYSSGMQLRLGFAIASHLDPDVFVVDEALAVGDAGFQAKCVERMSHLVREGRALLLVSHNLSMVESVCTSGLLLLDGCVTAVGQATAVVSRYLMWTEERRVRKEGGTRSSKDLRVESVTCHDGVGAERYAYAYGQDLEVRLHLNALAPIKRPLVTLGISNGHSGLLAVASMQMDGKVPGQLRGRCTVGCRFKCLPLVAGIYEVWGAVVTEHGWGALVDWQPLATFRIEAGPWDAFTGRAVSSHLAAGALFVRYEWTTMPAAGAAGVG